MKLPFHKKKLFSGKSRKTVPPAEEPAQKKKLFSGKSKKTGKE